MLTDISQKRQQNAIVIFIRQNEILKSGNLEIKMRTKVDPKSRFQLKVDIDYWYVCRPSSSNGHFL